MEKDHPLLIDQDVEQILISDGSLSKEETDWAIRGFKRGSLTFEEATNPLFIHLNEPLFKIAVHEGGHALVARSFGWSTGVATIIPQGNTLGLTTCYPEGPTLERHSKIIAVKFGGEAAEEAFGITNHSGAGADRAGARFLSQGLYKARKSFIGVLSSMQSQARSVVYSAKNRLEDFAWLLTKQKVIVNP